MFKNLTLVIMLTHFYLNNSDGHVIVQVVLVSKTNKYICIKFYAGPYISCNFSVILVYTGPV